MNLDEIEVVLSREVNLKVCPICGAPFKPYHSRQKTCGNAECKRIHQCEIVKKRAAERKAENPNEYRASRRKAVAKYRQKKRNLNLRESELKELSVQWARQLEFDKKISEYGIEYGKKSAEKILESVPKIDVSLCEKGEKNE